MASWLDAAFLVYRTLMSGGFPFPQRRAVNYVGATLIDDPTNDATIVDVSSGPWVGVKSVQFQVAQSDLFVPTDTTGGPFSAILPEAPTDGEEHTFADVTGTWGGESNALTVDGNGFLVDGQPVQTGGTNFGVIHVKFYAALTMWKVL